MTNIQEHPMPNMSDALSFSECVEDYIFVFQGMGWGREPPRRQLQGMLPSTLDNIVTVMVL